MCPAEAVYQDASRSRQAPTDAALAVVGASKCENNNNKKEAGNKGKKSAKLNSPMCI